MIEVRTRPVGASGEPGGLARRIATAMLGRLRHGTLTIVEGGRRQTFGHAQAGDITATVTVRDPSAWATVMTRGGGGLGQAYLDGRWDSDDLVGVLRMFALNLNRINRLSNRLVTLRDAATRPAGWLRRASKSRDRRNVRAHYDLGDDFFELFLDSTMAYSSGIFASPETTLEQASVAKFDRICHKLGLGPGDHVIELGGGWGGFAIHAASRFGCRVTTTTISARQFDRAIRAVQEAGLAEMVTVLNQDYRDLKGVHSHLVSIEMIEAVNWRDHDAFFETCARLLRPDGRAAIQCIVIDDREYERAKSHDDFIKRYIFPGGCLPSTAALVRSAATATDLRLTHLDDIGPHYARTLNHWRARFETRATDVRALGYDEAFLRMWRYYLAYCEAGFLERHVSVVQMVLARRGWRGAAP
jgi:cyclopropane-fatty-acyl-phospholipid synthase